MSVNKYHTMPIFLIKATDSRDSDSDGEAHYSVPPSREDEIYVVLSKQRIKVIPRKAIE